MAEEILENVNTIGDGAASAENEAASPDDDFIKGFFGEDFEGEDEAPQAQEPEPFDQTEETTAPEGTEPEGEENPAASTEPAASEPERISFTEHGKTYSFDKAALGALAGAVGRSSDEFVEIYQKGCGFEALSEKYESAKKDSDLVESLAKLRGIEPDEFRREISAAAERIPLERTKQEILSRNPGISDEEAERWANAEVALQRAKEENSERSREERETAAAAEAESEDAENKLREIRMFEAAHPEIKPDEEIAPEVVEAFRSGVPLEAAYQSYILKKQNAELILKLQNAEKEKALAEQKNYNREKSPGSASSAAGAAPKDPFEEGLASVWG